MLRVGLLSSFNLFSFPQIKAPHPLRGGAFYILLFATYLIYSLIALRYQTT
ncbi:hypothetical protein VCHA39O220_80176 [Vibrio chagasii]|nr:hypothetical protein VCHA31O73_110042 [Vibrio chagasii]CAH6818678.1 hypothetical protein VCHA34P117_140041 [Vibrio chagasii]CAH6833999.1 hypothetical protein VCHA34P129_10020 [Vibrio chagasii]CAH6836806.1 hypothetical protein VCHA36O157_10176 [Vibrio chagasii]CAH6836835.1 hypothetical protein VCHA34P115_10014 [Vibrio chagasii]